MFYCEKCRAKADWPTGLRGFPSSLGTCEVCDKGNQECYDVPSRLLPDPKKSAKTRVR
ncbi:hypothetical protein LCGC14_1027390 [marine sediment metagenome]|uniref:Uncharacterized protein n=1 Tax=marine sediment metagenome TaxID=412755 RepID=A0A0F9NHF6_9ZZZZ